MLPEKAWRVTRITRLEASRLLQQEAQKCDRLNLFTFFHAYLIQSEARWTLSSTSYWLISA